ncbi:protein tramtrack, beta isoform-like isoform X2 [Pectinophora gossypiella]|uniref:protein tramtrack, beta isoform-like isoform X2 n=1 Tax=Pectinophora gossypiella TaxID=13191 RepID=UPI00214ED3D0|nr:protein tramtrack, beta isoform-like isoform X2 [Pectinophora gossypiella]
MASDEQFSLCWNNFHANMSAGFHGLLSRGDLVDVTLAAEGRLLQAHKLVLSVCSPYFQEMFKMNPTQHPIVFLKDVSHSALRDLLQFMYQGEVNVKQEELASFISTAEQLQVKGLTGNQNEESSTPSKPKPTSRPGPRSSQQRQSVMTKIETDLDSKPSSTPVAVKRPNRPSIASNNSSSSQSGPAKRKCVDPLEAGPSGSAKEEFVTIPDEDENNAVAPKMEPEFVNESMWDDDDDGTNNDETNFGEDDSNMDMTGFDGSATGDGNITGGGEGGAVGDAQARWSVSRFGNPVLEIAGHRFRKVYNKSLSGKRLGKDTWLCIKSDTGCRCYAVTQFGQIVAMGYSHTHHVKKRKRQNRRMVVKAAPGKKVGKKVVKKVVKKRRRVLANTFMNAPYLNGTVPFPEVDTLSSELERLASYFNQ